MSKGGSTSTTVEIPEYIEEAAKRNLTRADAISRIGYVPYYGADVAAMTPLQEAAMQNVAGQAGAFGLATPAGGPMAGMPAPQEFAGGVMGYSSAPMYEEALAELGARRPGQKRFIDELFIDPFTGAISAAAAPLLDYTTAFPATPVAPVDTGDSGSDGGYTPPVDTTPSVTGDPIADLGIQPNQEIYESYPEDVQEDIVLLATDPTNIDYDVAFRNVYDYQSEQAESDPYGMSTGVGITPEILDATGGAEAWLPPTEDDYSPPSSRDSSPRPVLRPTAQVTAREDSFGSDLARSLTDENYDPPGNVVTRALGITETSDSDGNDRDDSGGGNDGCVIATHAVAAGGFTPSMKREAVVWCMHNLHDKWWGEAIRRGYRHLGRKKIEQGKAHEHYAEFRDYIAFANGKKRTLKGAINFTLRTAQFFAVGLIKKEA